MQCRTARRLAAELVERPASESPAGPLAQHLASCVRCALFLEELRRSWDGLANLPEIEASPDFVTRFRARAARPGRFIGFSQPLGWHWMALACSLAVVVLCTLNPRRITPPTDGASGFTVRDVADDRFLHELDDSLSRLDADFPVFDSWPNSLLDPGSQESPPSP
jgi:hypothetical protein